MSPFITFKDKDSYGELQYYILQREPPHYLGVIKNVPISGAMSCAPVPGYHFFVVFAGTLRGNMIPANRGFETEIDFLFNRMASWFYSERIMINESKFKKFKIGG